MISLWIFKIQKPNEAYFFYEIKPSLNLPPDNQNRLNLTVRDTVNAAEVTIQVPFHVFISPRIEEAKLCYSQERHPFIKFATRRTITAQLSLKNGTYPISEVYYDISNCEHRGFHGYFLLDKRRFSQVPGASSSSSYLIYTGNYMVRHKEYMEKVGCSTGANPALGEFWVMDSHGNRSDHVRVNMTRG